MSMKIIQQHNNGQTWADPSDPNSTIRFKTTANPKILDGQRTTNYVTEIIFNKTKAVEVGGKTTPDALSVRFRFSGALQSQGEVAAMATQLASQLAVWVDEGTLTGFPVETAPLV